jgi:hypothetical protein
VDDGSGAQVDVRRRSSMWPSRWSADEGAMLTVGMVVLGLAAFAAMFGFVAFCDRV